jgi:hypothetical protein
MRDYALPCAAGLNRTVPYSVLHSECWNACCKAKRIRNNNKATGGLPRRACPCAGL